MTRLEHRFVDFIPDEIEDGIIYISIQYCTAIHRCACGCGNEVVTPISSNDWKLFFDGKHITLSPSIGNWSFKCRSHYWIRNSEIRYADQWNDSKVKRKRRAHFKDRISNSKNNKPRLDNKSNWFVGLFRKLFRR